jgi:myosin heavy subunit
MATDAGSNSQRKLLPIAVAIIAVLLIVNVILLVGRNRAANTNKELTSQLDESEQLKAELEKEYYEALSELEEMRGSNEELNALIEKQKGELKESKTQIEGLLRNKSQLAQARREIQNMTSKVQEYVAEINKLKQENQELMATTDSLSTENRTLATNLSSQQDSTRRLVSAREALLTEKEQLMQTKEELSKKVNIASVVKVKNIEVEGQKVRNNGKTASRGAAKNVEQIQVCFETTANDVTENPTELFLVRIINPNGETLAIESLGSGTFQDNSNMETVRFTKMTEMPYDNDVAKQCTVWSPGQPFSEGQYTVEIYNKGYLAGTSTFEFR